MQLITGRACLVTDPQLRPIREPADQATNRLVIAEDPIDRRVIPIRVEHRR
jgi:hypothetical protein